jgi:hypothetical protein
MNHGLFLCAVAAAAFFRSPQEHGKLLVKRLVALPGDKVRKKPLFSSGFFPLSPSLPRTILAPVC